MASQDQGIYSFEECVPEGSDYLQQTLERAHTRQSLTHNKRKEDGSNWRSRFHRRYLKRRGIWRTQFLKNLLSILIIWIRNDVVMNDEDDEAEGSIRSLPTKLIKISIQFSFHDIIWLCICLYSVDVLCMKECLH